MPASDSVFRKFPFFIGVALLVLFCLAGIGFAVLQSGWAQKKMFSVLAETLHESGWKVSAEKIHGSIFEEIELRGVEIVSPEGDEIRAATLKVHLSTLRLLQREIAFQNLQADQITWKEASKREEANAAAAPPKGIPFALLFSNFNLTHIAMPKSESTASFQGTLRIGRYNKRAKLSARIQQDEDPSTLLLTFYIHSNGQASLRADYTTPSISKDASPWIQLPADGSANLHLQAKGAWSDFLAHLQGATPLHDIQGVIKGSGTMTKPPALQPLLERRWTYFALFDLDAANDLIFRQINIRGGSAILAKGSLALSKDFDLRSSNLQITANNLQTIGSPVGGLLLMHVQSQEKSAEINFSSPKLFWDGIALEHPMARLHLTKENGIFSGPMEAEAKIQGEDLIASTTLKIELPKSISFSEINVASSLLRTKGDLTLFPNSLLQGSLAIQMPNLYQLEPSYSLYGKAEAALRWSVEEGSQVLEVDGKGEDLYFGQFLTKSAHLYADFIKTGDTVYLELQTIQREGLVIDALSADAKSLDGITWDTLISAEGDWKGPFLFTSSATAVYEEPILTLDLQDLSGTLFFQPISLAMPAKLEAAPGLFRLHELDLLIGSASLQAEIDRKGEQVNGSLLLEKVPLDFLSLNPLDISVFGTINLNAQFSQVKENVKGTLKAEIDDIEIGTLGTQDPVEGHTLLSADLSQDRLSLAVDTQIRGEETLQISANIPWKLRFFPFVSDVSEKMPAKGHLSFNGRIEEILDFFNIGPHRLEGLAACDLSLRGDLGHPLVEGYCHLDDGYYENYVTGLELKQVQAEILAEKSSLFLRSLTAKDNQNKGSFSLAGELSLVKQNRFPFRFDGTFSRLNTTDLSWLKLEAGGAIQISGDIDSARVSGQAVVLEGDASIPERLPPSLPDLQIHYVNLIRPLPSTEPPPSRYPIFFDYRILAPEGIYISGRGLESEWKGDFQIGGTYSALEAKGELNMMKGDFSFAGRTFELTEGSLSFSGRPKEMPVLNLAARMQLQSLTLIARLKGFLNAPQLSFQSKPPLPLGSILSYLLFGEDMSEINAIQAAQIVNSVSTLSGGGSSVLDNTRRSIGLDRLRIIANPVTEEGAQQTYSLQVGKYVTRGVLISVSQGTQKDSTNLSVQIDLPNGLVLEAASMQQQEQGKFSLKWDYNY